MKTILLCLFLSLYKVNGLTVTVFGSSVANGAISQTGNGYWERLRDHLAGSGVEVLGRSVGGDTTARLLARFDDLTDTNPDIALIGLSLANEGLFVDREAAYNSYFEGMMEIVQRARALGIVAVIGLCYSNNDYSQEDYEAVKKMNLELQLTFNVPSINFLGALEDFRGEGHWAEGFWADGWHPNDVGHRELFFSIVPTLFTAIQLGRPMPNFPGIENLGVAVAQNEEAPISVLVENMHSFTFAFSLQITNVTTNGPGSYIGGSAQTFGNNNIFTLHSTNSVSFSNPLLGFFHTLGNIDAAPGSWHQVVWTHAWAAHSTAVYWDGVKTLELTERVVPTGFYLGGAPGGIVGRSPDNLRYRDMMIYRSALNEDEVFVLHNRQLVQGSLEVFAPLQACAPNVNTAQSLTEVRVTAVFDGQCK